MNTRRRYFKVQYDEWRPKMVADRARGLTWGQIALKYNMDGSNCAKLVKKYLLTHPMGSGMVRPHIGDGVLHDR